MRTATLVVVSAAALLLSVGAAAVPTPGATNAQLADWLHETTQSLFDAIATGDKSLWEKVLADDLIYTSETGEVLDRARFLAELKPLRAGFSGHIRIEDMTFRYLGTAVISHYLVNEWEDVFGQKLHTRYLVTSATELIALSPLVFFQKGSIHTMIFVPNADGGIREVLEEHKFNEVAMQRVP